MEKKFQEWHEKKVRIDSKNTRLFFHDREIWFCSLGLNIGFEADGKGDDFLRPVIIFKKFNNQIFLGIPLTKTTKKISQNLDKFYFSFTFIPHIKSLATLSQIRLIDASRLTRHIGEIKESEYIELTKKFKALLP